MTDGEIGEQSRKFDALRQWRGGVQHHPRGVRLSRNYQAVDRRRRCDDRARHNPGPAGQRALHGLGAGGVVRVRLVPRKRDRHDDLIAIGERDRLAAVAQLVKGDSVGLDRRYRIGGGRGGFVLQRHARDRKRLDRRLGYIVLERLALKLQRTFRRRACRERSGGGNRSSQIEIQWRVGAIFETIERELPKHARVVALRIGWAGPGEFAVIGRVGEHQRRHVDVQARPRGRTHGKLERDLTTRPP
jgi:hypothetical protein